MCDSIVAVVACGFYHPFVMLPQFSFIMYSDSWKQAYSFAYWHFKRLESYEPFTTHFIKLDENDTALCLQKLVTGLNHRVALPASIKPYVFTNLAWDNIDRLEETLTGKGTSHRVNGIAVQAKVYGPYLPRAELPHVEKKKQRSVMFRKLKKQLKLPAGRTWCGSFQGKHIKIIRQSQAGLGLISERGTKCQSQKMLLGICLQSMHQPQS